MGIATTSTQVPVRTQTNPNTTAIMFAILKVITSSSAWMTATTQPRDPPRTTTIAIMPATKMMTTTSAWMTASTRRKNPPRTTTTAIMPATKMMTTTSAWMTATASSTAMMIATIMKKMMTTTCAWMTASTRRKATPVNSKTSGTDDNWYSLSYAQLSAPIGKI